MRPSSLAQAITEPDSDTEPISAPSTPSTRVVIDGAAPTPENRSSSTAPIAAAEPPPMPLNSATICGMSVIATFLPQNQVKAMPMMAAATIRPRLCNPGRNSVATVAIRSEEHTSELQSLMRISYAVFCLKKKKHNTQQHHKTHYTITNIIQG